MLGRAVGLVSIAIVLASVFAEATLADSDVVSAKSPPEKTVSVPKPHKVLDKLKTAYFPNYSAKILMPVQFQKKDLNGQLTAMGADLPHGIYMFLSMTGPDDEELTPEKIKPIVRAAIEGMKAEVDTESSVKLKDYDGLEMRGKVKVEADVQAIARGYVAGKKLYLVSAMGTAVWINSKDVTRFFNSFEITP